MEKLVSETLPWLTHGSSSFTLTDTHCDRRFKFRFEVKHIIEPLATNAPAHLGLVKLILQVSFYTSAQTSHGAVGFVQVSVRRNGEAKIKL